MDFEVTVSTEIQKLLKQHKSLHVIDNGKKVGIESTPNPVFIIQRRTIGHGTLPSNK